MKPLLSVIANFYQSETYVKTCMESLLNQTLQDLEIIAVDDGSTDATPNMLKDYANAHENIKLIIQPNSGLALSRKAGLYAAQGRYITFVDGDDFLVQDIYEKMTSCACEENLDIVQCNIIPWGDPDIWKDVEAARQYPQGVITGSDLVRMYLNREVMPALWQRIFRREIAQPEAFKTTSKVMSDHFNFPEWATAANRVKILPDAGYYWLTRRGSLGQPNQKIQAYNAKNRFLSGISILGFNGVNAYENHEGVLRYLTSYMTQTAWHLRQVEDTDFNMVYDLWDTLKKPFRMLNHAKALGDTELTRFFEILELDRVHWPQYIRNEFLENEENFIADFHYNGDEIFNLV